MKRALLAIALVFVAGGCASTRVGPYSPMEETARSTTRAEQLNREAADLLLSDPEQAETLLREALTADLYFGPAHNNLGVLFLKAGKLYEAASEFEWARKLMPGHPDPRVNLGICLDRAGRISEAIESYEAALEVWPDYLPAVQGIALATVRAGRADARLAGWLGEIAMRSDGAWIEWARHQRDSRP